MTAISGEKFDSLLKMCPDFHGCKSHMAAFVLIRGKHLRCVNKIVLFLFFFCFFEWPVYFSLFFLLLFEMLILSVSLYLYTARENGEYFSVSVQNFINTCSYACDTGKQMCKCAVNSLLLWGRQKVFGETSDQCLPVPTTILTCWHVISFFLLFIQRNLKPDWLWPVSPFRHKLWFEWRLMRTAFLSG